MKKLFLYSLFLLFSLSAFALPTVDEIKKKVREYPKTALGIATGLFMMGGQKITMNCLLKYYRNQSKELAKITNEKIITDMAWQNLSENEITRRLRLIHGYFTGERNQSNEAAYNGLTRALQEVCTARSLKGHVIVEKMKKIKCRCNYVFKAGLIIAGACVLYGLSQFAFAKKTDATKENGVLAK